MKICDERKPKTNLFKEVNVGQVFYVENAQEYGNNPYMKINFIVDEGEEYFNAVDLQCGILVYVNDNEPVILCNATLQIY